MSEIAAQSCGFILELSPDWIVLRASQNAHAFLGSYHSVLVGEPLSAFTLAQPLHDLRNSLSRQRSATGIARVYRARLTDQPRFVDIAFQLLEDRILLEGVPSPDGNFGSALGSVSRLIDGFGRRDSDGFLDNAARRMRALTGFDHVVLALADGTTVQSSRGPLPATLGADDLAEVPALMVDNAQRPTPIFPPQQDGAAAGRALLRAPAPDLAEKLAEAGIRSAIRVPIVAAGETLGSFTCLNRAAAEPTVELHAAAELFAQVLGVELAGD